MVARGPAVSERIAVTTIVRGAPLDVPGGWLRVVDLDTGVQTAMAPVPDAVHRAADTNPRGGLRGGRGLASTADTIALAVNDRILLLDPSWATRAVLTHRWLGGIHDIAADDDGLWVTCADNDLLLWLDWDGRVNGSWHWRADRRTRRALGFGWLPSFDRSIDHRDPRAPGLRVELGHVNGVALDGDAVLVELGLVRAPTPLLWTSVRRRGGQLARRAGLGGLVERVFPPPHARDLAAITPGAQPMDPSRPGRPGWTWAVAELRPRGAARPGARIVARHPAGAVPSHNLAVGDGLLVVNESARKRLVALDRETGAIVRSVELPGEQPFPRGLLRLGDGRFVVGTQLPPTLYVVDLMAERLDERILLPDDRGEAPYAITAVPGSFGDPSALPATRAEWGIPGADASAPRADAALAAATG
jgi:hypothetical protein